MEWSSMDTAPRDGPEILLYGFYVYPGDADRTEYWKLCSWEDGYWVDAGDERFSDRHFNHWAKPQRPEGTDH